VPNSNFPTYAVGSVNETARRKVIIYSNNNLGILREGIFYHTLDLVGMCDLWGPSVLARRRDGGSAELDGGTRLEPQWVFWITLIEGAWGASRD
jgi:hypothetical protein